MLAPVVRDERRSGQLVGGTNKKRMVTYNVDLSEKSLVIATHSQQESVSVMHMSCGTVVLQA